MHRLSYSNVVATIALIAALGGGTAVAATHLAKGSVGSRELKDRGVAVRDLATNARPPSRARIAQVATETVTTGEVLDALKGAVQGIAGRDGAQGPQGPAGPQGPQGAPGIAGVVVRQATTPLPGQSSRDVTARCEAGETAIGGGGQADNDSGILSRSAPVSDGSGWVVVVANQSTVDSSARAFAVCARAGA